MKSERSHDITNPNSSLYWILTRIQLTDIHNSFILTFQWSWYTVILGYKKILLSVINDQYLLKCHCVNSFIMKNSPVLSNFLYPRCIVWFHVASCNWTTSRSFSFFTHLLWMIISVSVTWIWSVPTEECQEDFRGAWNDRRTSTPVDDVIRPVSVQTAFVQKRLTDQSLPQSSLPVSVFS